MSNQHQKMIRENLDIYSPVDPPSYIHTYTVLYTYLSYGNLHIENRSPEVEKENHSDITHSYIHIYAYASLSLQIFPYITSIRLLLNSIDISYYHIHTYLHLDIYLTLSLYLILISCISHSFL